MLLFNVEILDRTSGEHSVKPVFNNAGKAISIGMLTETNENQKAERLFDVTAKKKHEHQKLLQPKK